jgi:peptidoglycan/LPS O-acetylase OafA/YrhL
MFLRVAATLLVVVGHSAAFFKGAIFTQWPRFPYVQSMSVAVFFAVSGWTIAWVLDTRHSSYGRFAFDRFARLAIPLAPVLVVLAVLEVTHYSGHHPYPTNISFADLLANLAFLQNAQIHLPLLSPIGLGIGPYSVDRPLWTLAREFWIYIAFGGAFLAVRSNRLASMPAVGALLASLLIADSLFGGYGSGVGLVWLAGAGLYWVQRAMPILTWRHRLLLVPLQCFLVYCLFDHSLWPPGGTYSTTWDMVLFANFACFMLLAPGLRVPSAGMWAMTFLGSFAYTTYLVHYPLLILVRERTSATGLRWVLIMTLASLALAWFASLAFERRYRTIRNIAWNGGARLFARLPRSPRRQSATKPAEKRELLAAESAN